MIKFKDYNANKPTTLRSVSRTSSKSSLSAKNYSAKRSPEKVKFTQSVEPVSDSPAVQMPAAESKPLLYVDVDFCVVPDVRVERLQYFRGDDPVDVAKHFCHKYGLADKRMESALEQEIRSNCEKVEQSISLIKAGQ